ncbi:cell division protein ZapC domain-containing protein [Aliiglaciecola litoralis]|uniref:Cell division protein ZapC n=1 Tax=Aliiglaciecola litoralis TaxID=582857 RepID=A0ABP3WPG4_9ALTE
MLLPSANWKWFINQQSRALMVELDAGLIFQTAYNESQLKNVPQHVLFDIHHCQFFMESVEALEASGVPFDNSAKLQIGLNATAALSFHKPVLNKSWLYEKKTSCLIGPYMQLAWLSIKDNTLLMLSLKHEGNTVLCLNLSETFETNDGKTHPQFCLISVLCDRLLSFDALDVD